MLRIRINPLARQDLFDIRDYITNELDSPEAADRTVTKIIGSYEKLKKFPLLGMELSSKIDVITDYRYLISGNYIVFYKVDDRFVSIYRIIYARRDYIKVFFDNEDLTVDS